MQNTTAALQVVPLFIPSLRELHLQVCFGPTDAGGYLQPQSDVREAQGVRLSWRFPCRELRPTAWDGSAARVWELPAEGDGQPAAHAARLLQIGQVGLATCNSYSSGFSVPPDSRGAPTPLTLAFLAVYLHCSWVLKTSQTQKSDCADLRSGILCKHFRNINLRCLRTQALCSLINCCLFKSSLWALVGPYLTLLLYSHFSSLSRNRFYPDHLLWHLVLVSILVLQLTI